MYSNPQTGGEGGNPPGSAILRRERVAVAHRAYELWEAAGHPPGRALDFWLQAEGEIEAGRNVRKPGHRQWRNTVTE